ncbi:MBL fold metallo-hydrolase [Rubrobacter calidifluminis]|uniref:MBL fold metallo-hydrolase n=1 Tax=Rubrobacter calidifluminis TaxID=1392640 RepID=UPI00235E7ABC|nr:MBL fold metallo-hydrolase [Rubrobacter calidifluminis]
MLRVEFLGTGGAITTPRPLCRCRVCEEARRRGIPYSRMGPALYLHGPDLLVDTPEEIKLELERSRVERVGRCIYSHWHPDHVMGRRLFETMNQDWLGRPPESGLTEVYLPEKVARDFRRYLGSWGHLSFLEDVYGVVRLIELAEGEKIETNGFRITPIELAEDGVYAFLVEGGERRALVAPDELKGWDPPEPVRGVDLAVLPKGLAEFDPLTGERHIPEGHPVLKIEATFEETLGIVRRLGARRTVLTHIEEMDGLSYDDLLEVEEKLRGEGMNLTFAYDTLLLDAWEEED